MPLFRIENDNVLKISAKEFKNEFELEQLIENNLEELTSIKLLEKQYPIPSGRLDTLGIDEDNVPVVIEYKWIRDSNAIIQGLFYLDWVKNNKRTINLIVKEKLGGKTIVNWDREPRLIIIAKSFNDKELVAINQMKPNVELKKYSYYGDLFNIEDVNITKQKCTSSIQNGTESHKKRIYKEYSLEKLLSRANPKIRLLFEQLREKILSISDDVWEKVGSNYCDYRTNSTFASPNIQKDKIKIFIKMGEIEINDPENISKKIPESWGYGKLNIQFTINSVNQIDYAIFLIKQAYDYVT